MCNFEYETVSKPEPSRTPLMNLDNPNLTVCSLRVLLVVCFDFKNTEIHVMQGRRTEKGIIHRKILPSKDRKRITNGWSTDTKVMSKG